MVIIQSQVTFSSSLTSKVSLEAASSRNFSSRSSFLSHFEMEPHLIFFILNCVIFQVDLHRQTFHIKTYLLRGYRTANQKSQKSWQNLYVFQEWRYKITWYGQKELNLDPSWQVCVSLGRYRQQQKCWIQSFRLAMSPTVPKEAPCCPAGCSTRNNLKGLYPFLYESSGKHLMLLGFNFKLFS